MQTVAIVGTGLIGASFGLALKQSGFAGRIVGVSSPPALEAALAAGAIDAGAAMDAACGEADLIYLAQPIARILETLGRLDPLVREGALVTDAGSTKQAIVTRAGETLRRARFLGGHPMAGKESRGAAAADGALFRGRTYVLTPVGDVAPFAEFRRWLARIGANEVLLDAARHDRIVAMTSHLPQLASTVLAGTVGARCAAVDLAVSGPGLADMTRLALSGYELWRDIVATNPDAIDAALAAYIDELQELRASLRAGVEERFARGAALAKQLKR